MTATLLVIAKAPVAGRVKTRLCPPCTPSQAARLAHAALADTLAAVASVPGVLRVLALDGDPAGLAPAGFGVVAQRGEGLDERLAAAFAAADGPALLVGMDTPQVTPAILERGLDALAQADAVLGPADDGGYWAVGLRDPRHAAAAFPGVPMSTAGTGAAQHRRLRSLGLTVESLPALRDVDTFVDARAVAASAPASRFAGALAELRPAALAA
jgi:rSAM/selenodomain-associated transferase 1